MDEKLRKILSLQKLQEDIIEYRNNGHLLRKIAKQTEIEKIKKLQNVQISFVEKELKLLTPEQWVKCQEIENPRFDVKAILGDIEQTSQGIDLLK